jgi:hypothetical protein
MNDYNKQKYEEAKEQNFAKLQLEKDLLEFLRLNDLLERKETEKHAKKKS